MAIERNRKKKKKLLEIWVPQQSCVACKWWCAGTEENTVQIPRQDRIVCVCVRSVGNICLTVSTQPSRHIIAPNLNHSKTESRGCECWLADWSAFWMAPYSQMAKWVAGQSVEVPWHYRTHYRLTGASGASNWLKHTTHNSAKEMSNVQCGHFAARCKLSRRLACLAGHFFMSDQLFTHTRILRHS